MIFLQEWANEMCHDIQYSISNLNQCPVKVLKSHHAFYNKTVFMNPRSNVASTKIITNSHIFAINNQYQNETVNVQLPFLFPFYGIVYSHIAISPLGQWFLIFFVFAKFPEKSQICFRLVKLCLNSFVVRQQVTACTCTLDWNGFSPNTFGIHLHVAFLLQNHSKVLEF